MTPIEIAFARHHRIGFQLSGGRDSVAALFYLKPLWARMDVYHLDTGDQFPEIRAVIDAVAEYVQIHRIEGDSPGVRRAYGLPSDLIPINNHTLGRATTGEKLKIIDRYECCARSLMKPMHERMRQDGITLIVRGQRDDEFADPPTRSGDTANGQELLFPIADWSAEDVDAFIEMHGLPVAAFYAEGMPESPDCMGCTAWWGDGRLAYLRRHHPAKFAEVAVNLDLITEAMEKQYSQLIDFKDANHG